MPLPELEELYTLYRTDLYRYLCHLTRDQTEAEDILSETFLRAMRRLPTYRGDSIHVSFCILCGNLRDHGSGR